MMTSWHLPENPLQKSGHGSLLQTHTGMVHGLPHQPPAAPARRAAAGLGGAATARWGARPASPALMARRLAVCEGGKHAQLTVKGPQWRAAAAVQGSWRDDFDAVRLTRNCRPCAFRSTTPVAHSPRPGYLRLYGNDSLNSTFTQSTVARRWQHFSGRRRGCSSRRSTSSRARADLLLQQQKLELLLCGLRGGAGRTIR
jgi:xylan 1,4-beta-xylosidase